jgi:hypothetical protein
MPNTNFDNVVLKDAEDTATGRGDTTAQMARIKADLDALTALVNDLKAKFNAHTHNGDGAQAGAYYTSPPRSNAATVTAGTAGTTSVANVTVTTK